MTEGEHALIDWRVLDIEVDGEPWEQGAKGICIGWGESAYTAPMPQAVLDDLANAAITKVTFTKFDYRWLRLRGIDVKGPLHDVQVMAWLLDETQELSLETTARQYLGLTMDKRIQPMGGRLYFRTDEGPRVLLRDAPVEQVRAYCERDLSATADLYVELQQRLKNEGLFDYWRDEMVPFTEVLAAMEARGVPVDLEASEELREKLDAEIAALELELLAEAGLPDSFNLHSAQQLGKYLYKSSFELKDAIPKDAPLPDDFNVGKTGRVYIHGTWTLPGRGLKAREVTDTGQPSTSAGTLRTFYGTDPWVRKLLDLKQRQTIVSNFLENFPRRGSGGRLYGRFVQTGTVTGRLSSNSPNLQNVPARTELGHRVRELFRPEAGMVFIHGDYGQLEPRLMAHFSGDPAMRTVYLDGEGDIYNDMARGIFGEASPERRGICKTLVLAISYGAGARKIAAKLTENGHPTREAVAKGYLDELRKHYETFFRWREYVIEYAAENGYAPTIGGRKRHMAAPNQKPQTWKQMDGGYGERQAVNAVIQGSAADIVARTMVCADREMPMLALLVQVHDELLFEADDTKGLRLYGLEELQRIAERGHGFDLQVPLVFSPRVVANWAQGKD